MNHTRVRRCAGVAAATLALLAAGSTVATAADNPSANAPAAAPASPGDTGLSGDTGSSGETVPSGDTEATFTLVTGDTVAARIDAKGVVTQAGLRGPDGADVLSSTWTTGGSTYVMPLALQPLVDSGAVDPELFNITKLWADHYDDASTDTLPVIVEYSGGRQARTATPGATATVALGSIGGAGVSVDKDMAAAAWNSLKPNPTARSLGSVSKIYLDEVVHGTAVTDLPTPTVPLTGAGVAHDLGFDGTGVKVAVLDTGYDEAHPDLADQVVLTKSFLSGSAALTVHDGNGHGTHTASTVAGTGAASGGTYAGMAPGARLLIGKVLSDDGSGSTSGIIAGMQWAVAQGADVVSMSLGSDGATSCTGADVDAVQALGDQALFVIAAGNASLRKTVSTPGCAPKALTVGALDRNNVTAPFSSRGPSVDGWSAKPDIASQGVNVVAARADGYPEQPYIAESGTSMATPHVAGAAALLIQAEPDLTPSQVKDVLTSSTQATTAPVLDQGAGPLDVGRAVTEPVYAAPNLELGAFGYPQDGDAPVTKNVTLTNITDADVPLDLSVSGFGDGGNALPADFYTLAADSVVVPANGSVDVPVVIHPGVPITDEDYGTVTGRLVATGSEAADIRVTVPFSTAMQRPSATVHVVTKDRFGNAPDSLSTIQVIDRHDGTGSRYSAAGGDDTLTLPYGTYDFSGVILTRDTATGGLVDSVTQSYQAKVTIDGDTTITLDARAAKELSWKTPKAAEAQGFSMGFSYGLASDNYNKTGYLTTIPAYVQHLYATPATVDDHFTFEATAREYAPQLEMTSSGGRTVDDLQVVNAGEFDGTGSAPIVSVGPGTDANLAAADVAGRIVLIDGNANLSGGNAVGWFRALKGRGAVGVLAYFSGTVGRFQVSGTGADMPMISITAQDADALIAELADGPVTMSWTGQAVSKSPYTYNLAVLRTGEIVSGVQKVRNADLARVTADYFSQGLDDRRVYTDLGINLPGVSGLYAGGSLVSVRAPLTQTGYYTAGPDVHWTTIMRTTVNVTNSAAFDGPRTYTPGAKEHTTWLATPYGATLRTDGTPLVNRHLDVMSSAMPAFGDAGGHDSTGQYPDTTSSTVTVDGTPVAGNAVSGGSYGYPMPKNDSLVQFSQTFNRRASAGYQFGLSIRTDWSFRSSSADQGAQPLLVPVIDVPTDLKNQILAGRAAKIDLSAVMDTVDGPVDLNQARLQYAYGDETTVSAVANWQEASIKHNVRTGRWVATVPDDQPAGTFVHLRVIMFDGHNHQVDQQMVRAYQLGAPSYQLAVNTKTQCVNGDAMIAVYGRNIGPDATDITLTTPWGSKTVPGIAPGKAAYQLFDTGMTSVWAGDATIAASGTIGTLPVTTSYTKGYSAISCD